MSIKKIHTQYNRYLEAEIKWANVQIARCQDKDGTTAQKRRYKDLVNSQSSRIEKITSLLADSNSDPRKIDIWSLNYSYDDWVLRNNRVSKAREKALKEKNEELADALYSELQDIGTILEGLEILKAVYPSKVASIWHYQNAVYGINGNYDYEEQELLVLEFADKERQKFERLAAKFSQEQTEHIKYERTRIPENVRIEVWRRDQGQCASCGSREKLEYDHIVPVSRGGSNTTRNVELLCEACNRSKGDRIQ